MVEVPEEKRYNRIMMKIKDMKYELSESDVEYIVSGLEELCESDLEEKEYKDIENILKKLKVW